MTENFLYLKRSLKKKLSQKKRKMSKNQKKIMKGGDESCPENLKTDRTIPCSEKQRCLYDTITNIEVDCKDESGVEQTDCEKIGLENSDIVTKRIIDILDDENYMEDNISSLFKDYIGTLTENDKNQLNERLNKEFKYLVENMEENEAKNLEDRNVDFIDIILKLTDDDINKMVKTIQEINDGIKNEIISLKKSFKDRLGNKIDPEQLNLKSDKYRCQKGAGLLKKTLRISAMVLCDLVVIGVCLILTVPTVFASFAVIPYAMEGIHNLLGEKTITIEQIIDNLFDIHQTGGHLTHNILIQIKENNNTTNGLIKANYILNTDYVAGLTIGDEKLSITIYNFCYEDEDYGIYIPKDNLNNFYESFEFIKDLGSNSKLSNLKQEYPCADSEASFGKKSRKIKSKRRPKKKRSQKKRKMSKKRGKK